MSKARRLGRGLEALLGRTPEPMEPPIRVPAVETGTPTPVSPPPEDSYQGSVEGPYGPDPSQPVADEPQVPVPEPGAEQAVLDVVTEALGMVQVPSDAVTAAPAAPSRVAVDQIDRNPFQPRQDFDEEEMRSLAASLSDHGLLQPLVVRRTGGRYELIAGERRLRAAEMAGWTDVPVRVVEADDREVAELAIVENLQRKDLNPLEKAASFQRYLETYGGTQEELAGRLKLDRSTIANLIRLLELPDEVQAAVRRGAISQGHARALLPLGEEREQVEFARRVQQEGLNVRQTEALVQETIDAADNPPLGVIGPDGSTSSRARRPQSQHLAALEQEFRSALGAKVKITHTTRGRGKLVIHFSSHEEFERLRQLICNPDVPDSQVG